MSAPFTDPLMYWAGVNIPDATTEELDAVDRYYQLVHQPEVVAAHEFSSGSRYEKVTGGPRRGFAPETGPEFLGVFDVPNDRSKGIYFGYEDGPREEKPNYTPGPSAWRGKASAMWRIMWRQMWESGPSVVEPTWIRIIAMNPPASATESEIAEWSEFYSAVHAPEAIERRRWTRGTRWEVERSMLHPDPGCPRFFALYEAVEPGPSDAEVAAMGPFTAGPAIWKDNVTAWAIDYRRMPAPSA